MEQFLSVRWVCLQFFTKVIFFYWDDFGAIFENQITFEIKRKARGKYQNHPFIKVLRENIYYTNNISFDSINPEYISKIKSNLDTSKAT